MEYIAKTEIEDGTVLVSFPDCAGCQTEGANLEDARVQAEEALTGWLETHLQEGKLPPRPAFRGRGLAVGVPASLGMKLQLRWARADAGLTQTELAKRLGVSQQQIAKLEHPDYEPSVSKMELAAKALGLDLKVDLVIHDVGTVQVIKGRTVLVTAKSNERVGASAVSLTRVRKAKGDRASSRH